MNDIYKYEKKLIYLINSELIFLYNQNSFITTSLKFDEF